MNGGDDAQEIRVLIAAEHASAKYGGEAFLPLHYFRLLRERGIEAWLVCHERVRDELLEDFREHADRMYFVDDDFIQKSLWQIGRRLPGQVQAVTTNALIHLDTQIRQRTLIRKLVRQHRANVVHEPIPVSPTQPSALWGVGAPVVIGPMNGGMTYPAAFRHRQRRTERLALGSARLFASLANLMIPGKLTARRLLVANARTRAALPRVLGDVPTEELVENGVDFERFRAHSVVREHDGLRIAFVGRLIDWKALDIVIDALAIIEDRCRISLEVFGDGPMRATWERRAEELGLSEKVTFHGFVPQSEVAVRLLQLDVLVLPSVYECGGAVVLEAMALGLPVVATRWGGPADYLDESCGFLVEPEGPEQMRQDFARAIERLANEPELAARMGKAARERAASYDWNHKLDRMLAVYRSVIGEHQARR